MSNVESAKAVELKAEKFGKIMIELDIDAERYNVGFSNPETAQLMKQIEVNNMFSPFHAACILHVIRERRDNQKVKPVHNLIIQ